MNILVLYTAAVIMVFLFCFSQKNSHMKQQPVPSKFCTEKGEIFCFYHLMTWLKASINKMIFSHSLKPVISSKKTDKAYVSMA